VVVPIWRGNNKGEVRREAEALYAELKDAGLRMEVDLDEEHSPGWKFNEHELRGVPVRVELGPKDIEKGQAVLVRRDTREKEFVDRKELPGRLLELMEEIQENMLRQAAAFRHENTRQAESYDEFKEIIAEKRGFVVAPWDGTDETEQKVKEDTKATIRLLPFEQQSGADLVSGGPGKTAVFARATRIPPSEMPLGPGDEPRAEAARGPGLRPGRQQAVRGIPADFSGSRASSSSAKRALELPAVRPGTVRRIPAIARSRRERVLGSQDVLAGRLLDRLLL
jgi:hypothetical protein